MVNVGTNEPQGGELDGKIQRYGPGLLVREHGFAQPQRASSEAEASRWASPPSGHLERPGTKRPLRTAPLPGGVVYYC
jgi:hypothetical protein